jgi:hypothetical protein
LSLRFVDLRAGGDDAASGQRHLTVTLRRPAQPHATKDERETRTFETTDPSQTTMSDPPAFGKEV